MKRDYRRIALSATMLVLGVCLVASAAVSTFPNLLLPLGQYMGTHSSVAAAALGFGICVAAFNPVAHVSWIRIAIVYSILDVLYEIAMKAYMNAPFAPLPLALGIISAALLIGLYPQRQRLMPPARHETFGAHTTIEATI